MAMQAGMGFSKIIILVGAGYTGTLMMKNGKLSDVLAELQNLLKQQSKGDSDVDSSDAMAAQVRRLAMEVRQLASSRQITILNGGSGGNLTNIAVPAATLGVVGYAYMWWKGIKFSDLMYVTKASMATAVTNLTKHLEHVSDALAATKRHLTQRIENLDGKMDEQVEISKLIRNEVTDARGDISQIGYDLDELQRMVSGLDGKLLSLEGKQDLANAGVMYLCNIVNGKRVKMPDNLQDQLTFVNSSAPSLMGLKDIADVANSLLITNGTSEDLEDKPIKPPPRTLSRTASNKC